MILGEWGAVVAQLGESSTAFVHRIKPSMWTDDDAQHFANSLSNYPSSGQHHALTQHHAKATKAADHYLHFFSLPGLVDTWSTSSSLRFAFLASLNMACAAFSSSSSGNIVNHGR